jgi:hypothetical protein
MKNNNPLFIPNIILISILWLLGCESGKDNKSAELIGEIRVEFAPDKRVALWNVRMEDNTLTGETNLPQALVRLKSKLDSAEIEFRDEVTVLPSQGLGGKEFALVTLSVANIRSEPKHSAELATQATLGTPLKVLKKEGSWYLVQTPDQYISWVDAGGIHLMDQSEIESWYNKDKVIFTELLGYAYSDIEEQEMVSDLTAGNILTKTGETKQYIAVALPDGRSGFVRKEQLMPFEDWIASRETSSQNLITTAKNMMGIPYLWGGTSIKGVDCSGFTKTIFFLNGEVIPRDASQQVHEGMSVDTTKNWENLEVGDLLFFGEKGSGDKKDRVVHVGMWIGDKSFIHSRGHVRISSFDPESRDYDEYELNRYLRTQRIVGQQTGNIQNVEAIFRR